MAFDIPPKNKMMTAPPIKKGFHFASDGLHLAEYIEAATIEEATAIYHKIKRLIAPAAGGTVSTAAPVEPDEKAL
jgi:hypothetical protein